MSEIILGSFTVRTKAGGRGDDPAYTAEVRIIGYAGEMEAPIAGAIGTTEAEAVDAAVAWIDTAAECTRAALQRHYQQP